MQSIYGCCTIHLLLTAQITLLHCDDSSCPQRQVAGGIRGCHLQFVHVDQGMDRTCLSEYKRVPQASMPNPHHSGFVIYSWYCLSCLVRLRPTPKRSVTKPVVIQTSPVDGNRVAISLKKTVCRNADARELPVRDTSYQGLRFDVLYPGLSTHSPCVGKAGLHTLHSPPLFLCTSFPHLIKTVTASSILYIKTKVLLPISAVVGIFPAKLAVFETRRQILLVVL